MYFAPHILQVKVNKEPEFDDLGNPVINDNNEWEEIGPCSCYDNGQMKQVSVNGSMIDFSYHIVYEGRAVLPGEEIEVIDHNGNKRGDGKVIKIARCNYFNYSEIWV